MRLLLAILLVSTLAFGENDAKQAAHDFRAALKLQKKNPQRAFELFQQAAGLEPKNAEYATARELARQQLVYSHIQRGNNFLSAAKAAEAQDEFRVALALDPTNDFAKQRLRDLAPAEAPPSRESTIASQSSEIELHPAPGRKSFHFNGDSRAFLEQLGRAFNVTVQFDDSFISRRARIDLDDVDFYTALGVANQLSKSFGVPIDNTHLLMLANTPDNHRHFDHFSMRTFYLPDTRAPQEMNEIVSLLRSLFDIKFVLPQSGQRSVTVRAPKAVLDAASRFIENLDQGAPQIMLDLHAFEINQSMMRTLGVQAPNTIQVFHVPTVLASLTNNSGTQDLINQLIASGAINQSTAQSIPALLAQLQAQQNPLLSQGFATFGGGNTQFAVLFPSIPINFSYTDSRVTSLEQLQLRASQNSPATMKIGTRVPILNSSYAPVFNSSAISQVLQNQSFQAPFPSFSYEDIGINLKATPKIHLPQEIVFDSQSRDQSTPRSPDLASVTLDLDLQIRALTGQAFNGVPIISNRQYTGSVRLNEGEPAILVGFLTTNDQRSISGPVGIGQLPALGRALSNENTQKSNTELLIMITPHVIRGRPPGLATEQWLPPGS
jgi:general secretion pathway protein D